MKRVALYLRVSTVRQAEKDLSIPDQRREAESYCKAKGYRIVAEFTDPGASATDDKRPEFQKMLSEATGDLRPFDVVLVHSFSRFFRDSFGFEFNRRKLEKAGVELLSMTQAVSDDPGGTMLRTMVAAFDEYQSRETAKHVTRSMKENARQGFWNGARPPYGYRTVVAEWRGERAKKKLEIDPVAAETVKLIFRLYTEGDGTKGPLGVKSVCSYLNDRGISYIGERGFSVQRVAVILNRTSYIGKHYFFRQNSKTRALHAKADWVELPCPVIIDPQTFAAAQRRLKLNNPKVTPPRIVNGPTLLTGLALCDRCGSPMRLRTGKGGKYRYYTCSAAADKGKSACKGTTISMPKLDELVLSQLEQRVFEPTRLLKLLNTLSDQFQRQSATADTELKSLRRAKAEIERKLDNLYGAIEQGGLGSDSRLKDRITQLQRELETQRQLLRQRETRKATTTGRLDQTKIEAFASAMRERLRGTDPQFRKSYVRLFVSEVTVADHQVTIKGPKAAILEAALVPQRELDTKVPTFAQEWRARQDSNL
jgi:site-specific DNA recombinase